LYEYHILSWNKVLNFLLTYPLQKIDLLDTLNWIISELKKNKPVTLFIAGPMADGSIGRPPVSG